MESQTNHVLSHPTGAILQDYVIANFQFRRLGSFLQRVSQSLQIFGDRRKLTASLQNQKHKIQSKIFENIFDTDHWHKYTGVVHQFTETAIYILSSSFYQFFVNLVTGKLWICYQNNLCFLEIQSRILVFSLPKIKRVNSIDLSCKLSLTYGGNVSR